MVTSSAFKYLIQTGEWQTRWTSQAVQEMPNKVALRRRDNDELLELMSYTLDEKGLAVEIIYIGERRSQQCEPAAHQYIGIAKALFAYAAAVSVEAGFGGVLFFKAKTTELREYYIREFGAMPLGSYDPFRLIIWEGTQQNTSLQNISKEA